MYKVDIGTNNESFDNFDDAYTYAQKESWSQDESATIIMPDGKIIEVKI